MMTLAFGIGLCIAVVGVIGALVPAELVWIATHSTSSRVFIVVGAVRIVFGGLLISVSPASRAPQKLRGLGYIILLAGIGTIVTGFSDMERASDIIDWWIQQGPSVIRLTSLVVVALGGFVAWACAPARETRPRYAALAYWLVFALYTVRAAQDPTMMHPDGRPIVWSEVLVVWGLLAVFVGMLYPVLRPASGHVPWGRLILALALSAGMCVLTVLTFATDMPGHHYVPMRFWALTFVLLALFALIQGMRWTIGRLLAQRRSRASGIGR